MTAMAPPAASGSTPSLRSRTMPCSAASNESAECAGAPSADSGMRVYGWLASGSKRPARKDSPSTRDTDASSAASEVRLAAMAAARLSGIVCAQSMSVPEFSASAAASTSLPT